MTKTMVLSEDEIASALEALPDWQIAEGRLEADFVLPDFRAAIAFVTMVAIEAEVMDHHPDIFNSYKRVKFSLVTHSADNKLTHLDITLAKHISGVFRQFVA